jgi:Predicted aminoglycoside phosphotransferase
MQKMVEAISQKYFNASPQKITALGGGFYGRAFLAESKDFGAVVIKIYLCPNLAAKETCQLKVLSAHAIVKMPQVYFTHTADDDITKDAIVMEYLPGVIAGKADLAVSESNRRHIAETIVENLISYHKTVHPEGFGEINADSYNANWKEWYFPRVESTFHKAAKLHKDGKMDDDLFATVSKAYRSYDRIFYLPIKEARLIHGDYNMWNIMLNEELTDVSAVLDPLNCCWADSELDLHNLNLVNGKDYGLLDLYTSRFPMSDNYLLKMCFYDVFSKIMNYCDANVDIRQSTIPLGAKELERQMKYFGLS